DGHVTGVQTCALPILLADGTKTASYVNAHPSAPARMASKPAAKPAARPAPPVSKPSAPAPATKPAAPWQAAPPAASPPRAPGAQIGRASCRERGRVAG